MQHQPVDVAATGPGDYLLHERPCETQTPKRSLRVHVQHDGLTTMCDFHNIAGELAGKRQYPPNLHAGAGDNSIAIRGGGGKPTDVLAFGYRISQVNRGPFRQIVNEIRCEHTHIEEHRRAVVRHDEDIVQRDGTDVKTVDHDLRRAASA